MEYRHRAANLEKCMSELWRMERKRDKNAREMKVQGLGAQGRPPEGGGWFRKEGDFRQLALTGGGVRDPPSASSQNPLSSRRA